MISVPLLIVLIIICVIIMAICLFHMTEYMIYKKIWGSKKVFPLVENV